MAELPSPISVGDFYLAALLEEIKGLRADLALARNPAAVNNSAEFREPDRQGVETRGGTPPPPVPLPRSLMQRLTGR